MKNKPEKEPLALHLHDGIHLFQSEALFRDCIAAGWITPIVQRGRLCLFNRGEVMKAWDRISQGQLPPRRAETQPNPATAPHE